MVDTGTTGDFIDQDFIARAKFPTRKLSQLIPVYNMDGTLNKARSIREVVNMIMTYDRHSKCILLAVTCLGKQSMILRFTWLDKHNPEIDFRTRSVKMTRCLPHCCIGCQADRKAEQNAKREDTEWINACRTGPFPAFIEDTDEEDEAKPTSRMNRSKKATESGQPDSSPAGTHPRDRYGFPATGGRIPTELPACRSQKAHPAAPPRLPLGILQGLLQ